MKKLILFTVWLCVQSVCAVAQSEDRFYGSAGSLSFEDFSGAKGDGKLKKRGVRDEKRFQGVAFHVGPNSGGGKLQGHAFTRNLSGEISEITELKAREGGLCLGLEVYLPVGYISASVEGAGKGKTSSTPNYDAQGVYTPNVQREMRSKNHK
jgi:hypothetical protein